MDSVVVEGIVVLLKLVCNAGNQARLVDQLDVGLDNLSELLGHCAGALPVFHRQSIRFGWMSS
jgi:hypothetical protein